MTTSPSHGPGASINLANSSLSAWPFTHVPSAEPGQAPVSKFDPLVPSLLSDHSTRRATPEEYRIPECRYVELPVETPLISAVTVHMDFKFPVTRLTGPVDLLSNRP
jgi:hypothetical protein